MCKSAQRQGIRPSGLVIHTALEEHSASTTWGQDGVFPFQWAPSLPSSSVCEHEWNELLTTLFSIKDAGVNSHQVLDSGSLYEVGSERYWETKAGCGERRTRECQAFQLKQSGKSRLVRQHLTNPREGRRAGQVSGERVFEQRVEQDKGLIVINSCMGEIGGRDTGIPKR